MWQPADFAQAIEFCRRRAVKRLNFTAQTAADLKNSSNGIFTPQVVNKNGVAREILTYHVGIALHDLDWFVIMLESLRHDCKCFFGNRSCSQSTSEVVKL